MACLDDEGIHLPNVVKLLWRVLPACDLKVSEVGADVLDLEQHDL